MLNEYPFTVAANAVRILDGADEGSFAWVRSAVILQSNAHTAASALPQEWSRRWPHSPLLGISHSWLHFATVAEEEEEGVPEGGGAEPKSAYVEWS